MANQVEVLQLDINTSALIAKMTATRAEIDRIKQSQKELTATNQQSTDAFTKNEVELKRLQTLYGQQRNVVTQLNTSTNAFANGTEALTEAIDKEIVSIDAATENNKQLKAIRNQLNTATEEGAQALAEINKKIDENTAFIKANVSAAEQQKMEIGAYKDQIKEAFSEMNIFNGGLVGFIDRAKEAGGVAPLLKNGFGTITTAIGGMIKASLAFIATPLGAAIAAIAVVVGLVVGAFKFMSASMNSTEAGSQKLAKVTATITGIFRGLFNVIKPFGEWLGNAFVKYFETAIAIAEKGARIISAGLRMIGANSAAAGIDKFTNSVKQGAKAAADLAVAEGKLATMQRNSQKIQLDYQKIAEKLRQQRDDESNSIAKRMQINEQLGAVLKKQSSAEMQIANQQLKVANLRIAAEGKTTEALNAKSEAETNISDIQERITGQESEQLANLNSLRKEATDKAKEINDKRVADHQKAVDAVILKNKEELDLYVAQEGKLKKTMAEQLAFEESLKDKKLANLKAEFDAGKISKTKYETDKLNITNEFAQKQIDIAVANADKELELFIANNQTKLDNSKFISDAIYQQEIDRLNKISEAEASAQTTRLQNGLISAEEYAIAIKAIDDKFYADKKSIDLQREEEAKQKKELDLQNKIVADGEAFAFDLALQTEQENQRYQAELLSAEKTGADVDLIKQKHATIQKGIERSVQENKLQLASDTLGNLATILGKESKAGKAMAVAQATMDTYKAATSAYSAMAGIPIVGPVLGAVAAGAAVVAGIANVKKITSTKEASVPTRAEGGAIPTLRNGLINNGSNVVPLSNGDDTLAYVKQGEVILNQEQQARAGGHRFFQSIGVPGFANGGYVGAPSYSQANASYSIDYERLATSIAKANSTLPAPVVNVTDITSQQNRVQVIENYANLQ
ncbi:hypothetical protein [Flavobacterium sp. HTF]|uniref:hypothetical protein n=1 Tax=Flavobacterium sp. HTF TaxID=2170732 RepID=UPI000D5C9B7A|nr:hypothetical protein [Flavobacterium sp. HTF]PWB24645.1 hypothetical protein DCO46_11045 [Flavobacterium sp. HTF]